MKKFFSLVLTLIMLLSLVGCARLDNLKDVELPSLPDVNAAKESPAADATALPVSTPAPVLEETALDEHVIVGISSHYQQFFDPQNGTELILSFGYETPLVYIEGNDAASQAINEYIAALDETYNTGNDYGVGTATGLNTMLELATDHYGYVINSGLEGELGFELSSYRNVYVRRIDDKALSMVFHSVEYTGGAHGSSVARGYVFDTVTGELLTLDGLSSQPAEFKAKLAECMLSLYASDPEGYYAQSIPADFFAEGGAESAISALVREGSWCFDAEGLLFFSDLMELGPYSSGIIGFTVPYSELVGLLDSKWLPEVPGESGSLSLVHQSRIEDGSAAVIDRVVVSAEGEQLCLVAEGTVYDVRLSRLAYSDKFYETEQLWACSYMRDCLLQLSADIPEGMPDLMVSYTDSEGIRQRLMLTQSGVDGSLILTGEDIEAVG